MKTLALWLSITAFVFLPCATSQASSFPNKYDRQIEKAVKRYWPAFPEPLYWKAQLYQESLLNPDAVSPVGAKGLAQFMPGTWQDVITHLGYDRSVSPRDADLAIQAGAFYMAKLRQSWSSKRTELDRHELAQASYNAGLGNILKAQKLCDGARKYSEIIACLPRVTGRHSKETTAYVSRIRQWYEQMLVER